MICVNCGREGATEIRISETSEPVANPGPQCLECRGEWLEKLTGGKLPSDFAMSARHEMTEAAAVFAERERDPSATFDEILKRRKS